MNINTSNILEELSKNKHDNDRVNVNYYLYALYKCGEVIYIGQTGSLLSRIGSHANTKDFDEYSYKLWKLWEAYETYCNYCVINTQPVT